MSFNFDIDFTDLETGILSTYKILFHLLIYSPILALSVLSVLIITSTHRANWKLMIVMLYLIMSEVNGLTISRNMWTICHADGYISPVCRAHLPCTIWYKSIVTGLYICSIICFIRYDGEGKASKLHGISATPTLCHAHF